MPLSLSHAVLNSLINRPLLCLAMVTGLYFGAALQIIIDWKHAIEQ